MLNNNIVELLIKNIRFDKDLAYCESAVPWQLGFQDPATPIMEGIVTLHHEVWLLLSSLEFL